MEINLIENLLEKALIIKRKNADIEEYTGENFNIFNILNLNNKELIHSAFIGNLLNVQGNHGQKDLFLKLFIAEIKDLFFENDQKILLLNNFETLNSYVKIEEYLGLVNYESEEGGRADIVIKNNKHQLVIENKIYALDQPSQLIRYKKYYSNSPILYLTLNGDIPSNNSQKDLINGNDFICISYKNNIINWIEKCIKEMANKPIIRETLNQYLTLIKQLTNQTTNNKMEQELTDLILSNENNYNAFKALLQNQNDITSKLVHDSSEIFIEKVLNVVAQRNALDLKIDDGFFQGKKQTGVTFYNADILKDLCIEIEFQESGLKLPAIACSVNQFKKSQKHENLAFKFQKSFSNGEVESSHDRFLFSLYTKSSDMLGIHNINLQELKFNQNQIPDLIEIYDSIIDRFLSVIKNEYN